MTSVERLARFPKSFPPLFADAWGDDHFGLWIDIAIANVTQRFRWIEPGTFEMGSPDSSAHAQPVFRDSPPHPVTITRGFWLADTACTQALWIVLMGGSNPSAFRDSPTSPVEQVSWDDVQVFLRRFNTLVPGCRAALPTEAQWEYACRAGTKSPTSFEEPITPELVNYRSGFAYAPGDKAEPRGRTVPVKSMPANSWGLYEMHGNVWEWCADGLRTYANAPEKDPEGPTEVGVLRALRGGSWLSDSWFVRSTYRYADVPRLAHNDVGFRLCLSGDDALSGARAA